MKKVADSKSIAYKLFLFLIDILDHFRNYYPGRKKIIGGFQFRRNVK